MATQIIMPKVDPIMKSATIVKWFKKPGEKVEIGEPLLEIETLKASLEVEAESSGIFLKALKKENDVVCMHTVIGYIGEPGEEVLGDGLEGDEH